MSDVCIVGAVFLIASLVLWLADYVNRLELDLLRRALAEYEELPREALHRCPCGHLQSGSGPCRDCAAVAAYRCPYCGSLVEDEPDDGADLIVDEDDLFDDCD